MPVVKKNAAATSAAIQTGLSVRGAVPAVKASKVAAKKAAPVAAAKKAGAAKAVRTRVIKVKAAPAADAALWEGDIELKAAAMKIVRHVHKYSKMDGFEFMTLASANAYWAQAVADIDGFNPPITKGSWFLAFDYVDRQGATRTRIYHSDGSIAKDFEYDGEQGQGFSYFND